MAYNNQIANRGNNNQMQNRPNEMNANAPMDVFSSASSFEVAARMSDYLAGSTIVPRDYQHNQGNCLIAIDMANRIKTSPMMVMQNLYIVNGRPAWSSQWIIAMINSSRRYKTELQFEFGNAPEDGGLSCTAWVEDWSGHRVTGPKITMTMANAEGWTTKNGSKWKTMPQVMIQYRAASFFGRMNCPDMVMGIYSADEAYEMDDVNAPINNPVAYNESTGTRDEIVESVETVKDVPITQQDRQNMFKLARKVFGLSEANEKLKAVLSSHSIETTEGMMKSVYNDVMNELMDISAKANEDKNPDAIDAESVPVDEDSGSNAENEAVPESGTEATDDLNSLFD